MKRQSGVEYCSPQCSKKYNLPKGFSQSSSGYILILVDKKYLPYHRFIIEQKTKRKLKKDEIVHHKNGIKSDNRIANLEVLSFSDHVRLHAFERAPSVKEFIREKRKNFKKRNGQWIKKCKDCNRWLPLDGFVVAKSKNRHEPHITARCRSCHNINRNSNYHRKCKTRM